jgi:hypothetical protein
LHHEETLYWGYPAYYNGFGMVVSSELLMTSHLSLCGKERATKYLETSASSV